MRGLDQHADVFPPEQYPEYLDKLSVDMANGMAQFCLEPLTAMNPAAARITDKMPLHFLHPGLISLLLPDAKIIHCRRDSIDTSFSCYMTPFNSGNDFEYDLTNLGLFYRQYQRLMNHWKSVLAERPVACPVFRAAIDHVIENPPMPLAMHSIRRGCGAPAVC